MVRTTLELDDDVVAAAKELAMIESVYQKQFGTAALVTTTRVMLMQKFFDSVASRVKHSFSARANSPSSSSLPKNFPRAY